MNLAAAQAELQKLKAINAELLADLDNYADALFTLGMVDRNNRIDEGESPGKGWEAKFVAREVRRVVMAAKNDPSDVGDENLVGDEG